MADEAFSKMNPPTGLQTPLFVPFQNAPAGGFVLYYDDFHWAERKERFHLLCGDAAHFKRALGDCRIPVTRLTVADAFLFFERKNPIVLLQNGAQILKYDTKNRPDHILALKALLHQCGGLVGYIMIAGQQ